MKRYLGRMIGASMGLSYEDAGNGGGGATTAPPPAPAAPAPAPAAPAPAPAKPKGMFDRVMPTSLKRLPGGSEDPNRTKAPPAPAKPAASTPESKPGEVFNVLGEDGKTVLGTFKTQAEAQAFVDAGGKAPEKALELKPGETAYNVLDDDGKTVLGSFKTEKEAQDFMAANKPAPAHEALPRPIMGRFKTATEVEEYINQSGQHAQKLYSENKALKDAQAKAISDREAMEAAHKAEIELLRATPAFKELSKEELSELAKEDPVAAADYIAEKKFRDRDAQTAKTAAETRAREKQEGLRKTNEAIERRRTEMQKDPENFPQFEEMAPLIGDLLDMTQDQSGATPLRGHEWAEELLYLAALGISHRASLKKGKTVLSNAEKKVMTIAAAAAAATNGPTGGGSGRGSATGQPSDKESKGSRIVKAAPRTTFFGGKPKT